MNKSTNDKNSTNPSLRITHVGGMLRFIDALRQTDKYIEMIYMNGACYQFHLLLKTFFPESKPYITKVIQIGECPHCEEPIVV